jgi:hypothetical protein
MSALSAVLKEVNAHRTMYGERIIDSKYIMISDARDIFRYIDNRLSPEWLYQDGERSTTEAHKIRDRYVAAVTTLIERGYNISKRDTLDLYYELNPNEHYGY